MVKIMHLKPTLNINIIIKHKGTSLKMQNKIKIPINHILSFSKLLIMILAHYTIKSQKSVRSYYTSINIVKYTMLYTLHKYTL